MSKAYDRLPSVIIQEHWSHIRHIESERRWMFMAYGTIVAGSLVYLSGARTRGELLLVLGLLFLFSLLWLIASLRLKGLLDKHHERLKDIADRLGEEALQPLEQEWLVAPQAPEWGPLKLRYLFPSVYGAATIAFFVLLLVNALPSC